MTNSLSGLKWSGVWTALATPFDKSGLIDWVAFDRLLSLQEKAGVSGIVISGTTGESPTLSVQEKVSLVRKARAKLGKDIRLMAGSGGNCTNQSIELSKLCVDAGADSLLIVTPPYNKPSLLGLSLHYRSIADAVNVPLCLYHVPGRTGQLLSAHSMAQLTQDSRVGAIKEASGDIALFGRTAIESPAELLSGDDPTYLASLAVGGVGVISVVSNIYPSAFVMMTKLFHGDEKLKALKIHQTLFPVIDHLFCESNPGPLKAALEIKGLAHGYLRPPLASVVETNYIKMKDLLSSCDEKLRALGAHES